MKIKIGETVGDKNNKIIFSDGIKGEKQDEQTKLDFLNIILKRFRL